MPLLDHFRTPVTIRHRWPGFHAAWAGSIAFDLNTRLPPRFLAEIESNFGNRLIADVAEFETPDGELTAGSYGGANGNLAVATYSPPRARYTAPLQFPDTVRVNVLDMDQARLLVAVVELVSPSNKHDPVSRQYFAARIGSILSAGVGVVLADIVTISHFNLHDELIRVAKWDAALLMPADISTYVVSYQPISRDSQGIIDMWPHPLSVGDALPTLPLALRGYGCVPLDLEATYAEACRRCRIG